MFFANQRNKIGIMPSIIIVLVMKGSGKKWSKMV